MNIISICPKNIYLHHNSNKVRMQALYIQKTEDTPEVRFEPQEGVFSIMGRSWPENAIEMYSPLITWFNEYFQKPNGITNLDVNFEYFNTASAKQFAKLLMVLEENADKSNIEVNWMYEKDDLDMLNAGMRYSKLIKLPFKFTEASE